VLVVGIVHSAKVPFAKVDHVVQVLSGPTGAAPKRGEADRREGR